jgi:hypothetical protein
VHLTAIGRKAAIVAASLVLVLLMVGSVAGCAESDSFEFKPRTDPARCQSGC